MSLTAGSRLGPYEVLSPIGAGGMGEVYRARDTRLSREVAIKVLPSKFAADPERLLRFEQEAHAVAALSHPSILALYDVGSHEEGPFVVTELLQGETLKDRLAGGPLSPRTSVEIGVQIAQGLSAAHAKGVVHRDVKPANIFVTSDGVVKILDFGLAKLVRLEEAASPEETTVDRGPRTENGTVLGTMGYISPEQLRGEEADARSDIFGFGCVLYEMLAGRAPFLRATGAETITAIMSEDPPPLSGTGRVISPALEEIVRRCLEKHSADRFSSAHDLALALRAQSGASEVPVTAPSVPAQPRVRRRWAVAAAAAGSALLLVAAGAILSQLRWKSRPIPSAPYPIKSVAVLPFENLGHDPSQDYFVDGMHDAIITDLAKLGVLRVTSRSSVMSYKGKQKAMREIAQELGVDALIEGSVLRVGNKVRITAQLIRGATDEQVWAENYDRDLEDILRLLSDVSRAIAGEVRLKVAGGVGPALPPLIATPPRVRPEAWEAYLRGRQVMIQGTFSPADLRKALDPFQQAVSLDPGFARGWSGVAMVTAALGFFRLEPVAEVVPKAREAALKAIALDDRSGEAYGVLGTIELYFDWNFDSARRDLERAVALTPHDLFIRHAWADYLMVTRRLEESVEQVKIGRSYEPTSPLAQVVVLFHTMTTRRYDEVIVEARRTVATFPKFRMARGILGEALWREGRYDEALEQYKLLSDDDGEELRLMEKALRQAGPRAALKVNADSVASEVQASGRGSPIAVANAYAEAGERDMAFQWLEKAFVERTPQLLHIVADPAYDDLRGDPRYKDLIRRIGIPVAGGIKPKG